MQRLHVFVREAGQERMLPHDFGEIFFFHGQLLSDSRGGYTGFANRRGASRVMSMPTGHQVMHRPQPDTAECRRTAQPSWTSLCVSHWRYRVRVDIRILPPAISGEVGGETGIPPAPPLRSAPRSGP